MGTRKTRSESVREHTQRTGEELRSVAGEAGERAREEARDRAASFAGEQRSAWAHEVEIFANAIGAAGRQLDEDHAERMALQTRHVADGLQHLAADIRERDAHEALHAVNDFARRRPATFVGASVAAGFLLSRFLKAAPAAGDGEAEAGEAAYGEGSEAMHGGSGAATRATPAGPAGPVAPTSAVGPVPDEGRPATEVPANPADPDTREVERTV